MEIHFWVLCNLVSTQLSTFTSKQHINIYAFKLYQGCLMQEIDYDQADHVYGPWYQLLLWPVAS